MAKKRKAAPKSKQVTPRFKASSSGARKPPAATRAPRARPGDYDPEMNVRQTEPEAAPVDLGTDSSMGTMGERSIPRFPEEG